MDRRGTGRRRGGAGLLPGTGKAVPGLLFAGAVVVSGVAGWASTAAAGPFDKVAPVTDPLVQKECGACHFAFQPVFLPADAWRAVLAGLVDHYGEDASGLSAEERSRIEAALTAGATPDAWTPTQPGQLPRFTRSDWFAKEHQIVEAHFSRPAVRSRTNCPACHLHAAKGRYDD